MNLSEIILSKLRQQHEGKENAIKRKELLSYCHFFDPDLTDRQLRNIYCQLPVISSEVGIFWPIRKVELEEFREYCRKKALPLFLRFKMVAEKHGHLMSDESTQWELFQYLGDKNVT